MSKYRYQLQLLQMLPSQRRICDSSVHFRFHRQIPIVLALCIFLLFPASSRAYINKYISRTDTPGNFFIVYPTQEDDGNHLWLKLVSDYGEMIETVRDSVVRMDYHPSQHALIMKMEDVNFHFSQDTCETHILISIAFPPRNSSWFLEPDSLILFCGLNTLTTAFSRDTLRSVQEVWHEGLEHFGTGIDQTLGWGPGEILGRTWIHSLDDSVGINFSDDYGQHFRVIQQQERIPNRSGNVIFNGFSPGELLSFQPDRGWVSADTGKTWQEIHRPPNFFDTGIQIGEAEPGWQAGEYIWYGWYRWSSASRDAEHFLFHTTDYGVSWQPILCEQPLMYPMRGWIEFDGTLDSVRVTTDYVTNASSDIPLEMTNPWPRWWEVEPVEGSVSFSVQPVITRQDTVPIEVTIQPGAFTEAGEIEGVVSFDVNTRFNTMDVVLLRGYIAPSNVDETPGFISFDGDSGAVIRVRPDTIRNASPFDTLSLSVRSLTWSINAPRGGSTTIICPEIVLPGDTAFVSLTFAASAFSDTGEVAGVLELSTNSRTRPQVQISIQGHVSGEDTSVRDRSTLHLPATFEIESIYPNPFNSTVNISLSVPQPGLVNLQLFNTVGQLVYESQIQALSGRNNISILAKDLPSLSTGIYLLRVKHQHTIQTHKLVYLK